MEDMKKLVEKYKQELMEYKKAAAPQPEPQPFDFPEMLDEQPAPQTEQETVTVTADSTPEEEEITAEEIEEDPQSSPPPTKQPQIIGYADEDKTGEAERAIESILSEERTTPRERSEEDFDESAADDHPCCEDAMEEEEAERTYRNKEKASDGSEARERDSMPEKAPDRTDAEETGDMRSAPSADDGIIDPDIDSLFSTPISGSSRDEQLGRRSFEDDTVQVTNSRADIKPLVQQIKPGREIPEPDYANMKEFNEANERRGTLRFRTYTARGAFPVKDATCIVTKKIGGKTHTFYTLKTDMSGQTPIVSLPAPPAALSQSPDSSVQPYAQYDAKITAKGYAEVLIEKIPIFDGVLSIQRTAMLPVAEEGEVETLIESEPDLNGGK